MISDAEDIVNDDEFFSDTVDTPKKGIEQHKKREGLKGEISKGKLLDRKKQWTHKIFDKDSDKTTNKTYGD